MQEHNSANGTTLRVYVRIIDENGDHIDPDGWSANPNSANVVITEQPSAVHAGTKIGVGEYRFDWTGLTAIAENTVVHCEINGAIGGTAWTEWIEPVRVLRNPLTTLGTNAPSNWINAAAIVAGALNGKGDWLTTLGANAPAGWINAAAIVAAALNDKGNWSKAGDAMALTSGERSTLATAVEAALLNEGDGQQLLAAISAQVQALFDNEADVPVSTLITLIRDGILNRVLSGNHETAGTTGKLLQNLDVAVSTRATPAQVRTELATELAVLTTYDDMFADLAQMIQNDGSANAQFTVKALELAPAGGGGGGSGDAEQATLLEVQDTVESVAAALSGTPIRVTGRVVGGNITAYVDDDYKVRSGTALAITVADVGGTLSTKLNAIGVANLAFGASRPGKTAGEITGTIAGVANAANVTTITVEITACGSGLRPGEFTYQIQSSQTHSSEVDDYIELEGLLTLQQRTVAPEA